MTPAKLLWAKSKKKFFDDELKEHTETKYVGIANGANEAESNETRKLNQYNNTFAD